MNNSSIVLEETRPELESSVLDRLEEEEGKLIRIVKAIREVKESKPWSVLKELIFDDLAFSLQKDLTSEAKKDTPDPLRLNRFAGQLKWAERYANLDILEGDYSKRLTAIKLKTHG